jgi:transglutaminase-like putative cysteine protease
MRRYSRFVLWIVAVLLPASSAFALDTSPTGDYSKGILDRQAVMAEAVKATSEAYPNADDVLVDDHILVRYEADGRGVTWDDTYMKVLTEKGKRDNETLDMSYQEGFTKVSVPLLEVIKPDGTAIPVDVEKQSRSMIDCGQMADNIYDPNQKSLSVGIPGLEVGDVMHYVTRRETVKARVPDTWGDYQVLEYTSPIKRMFYEVYGPKSRPLRSIALKSEVEGTVKHEQGEKNGQLHYQWEARDVPRMYEEPSMPAMHTVVQRLLVSTSKDWQEISKWYWKISQPHYATTPEMKDTVDYLTNGAPGRDAKMRAIFDWVSQRVRYMGITVETESPGYEPHDVKLTFENLHGVCRDKAALLVAMLRLAGFEAYPVMIEVGAKLDTEVPLPWFNHAIAAVRNDDGTYILMDPTDEQTRDMQPAYLCDRTYLVATPQGEKLLVSNIIPASKNMMGIETQGHIDAKGTLNATTTLRFDGINDNAYRGYFARLTPDERRQFFEGHIKDAFPGGKLDEFVIAPVNMQDTATSLSIRLEYEAPEILIAGDRETVFPLPRFGNRMGLVNFVLDKTGLEKRKYPFVTEYACGVHENFSIELDPALGSIETLPEFAPVQHPSVTWNLKVEQIAEEGGPTLLKGEGDFRLNVVEFSPEQYMDLKTALKDIEYETRKKPILQSEAGRYADADAIILNSDVYYNVKDEHNWTVTRSVKKRIQTYKGQKDHAEIPIDFNPVWGNVEIVKAVVRNKGQEKAISKQEINLMDAGWVGSAPRYPAGKTLVASLPSVEIGSEIEYTIRIDCRNRPFFTAEELFQTFDPVEKKTVRIEMPRRLEKRLLDGNNSGILLTHALDPTISARIDESERFNETSDTCILEWKATDMPTIEREEALPPMYAFTPVLHVSLGNWSDYAKEVRTALVPATKKQMASGDRATSLTESLTSDTAKILAIRDFVAKSIRSAGPSFDSLPLTAVSPADVTLKEGYGNSADRAILLATMLDAAGFSPQFVLASTAPVVPSLQEPPLGSRAGQDARGMGLPQRHESIRRTRNDFLRRTPRPRSVVERIDRDRCNAGKTRQQRRGIPSRSSKRRFRAYRSHGAVLRHGLRNHEETLRRTAPRGASSLVPGSGGRYFAIRRGRWRPRHAFRYLSGNGRVRRQDRALRRPGKTVLQRRSPDQFARYSVRQSRQPFEPALLGRTDSRNDPHHDKHPRRVPKRGARTRIVHVGESDANRRTGANPLRIGRDSAESIYPNRTDRRPALGGYRSCYVSEVARDGPSLEPSEATSRSSFGRRGNHRDAAIMRGSSCPSHICGAGFQPAFRE